MRPGVACAVFAPCSSTASSTGAPRTEGRVGRARRARASRPIVAWSKLWIAKVPAPAVEHRRRRPSSIPSPLISTNSSARSATRSQTVARVGIATPRRPRRREAQLAPASARRSPPRRSVDRVVVYDDHAVRRRVDVQLDPLRAGGERRGERGKRVLALPPGHPAMGDSEWRTEHRDRRERWKRAERAILSPATAAHQPALTSVTG